MVKWEYQVSFFETASIPEFQKSLNSVLNQQGQNGWELTQILQIEQDGSTNKRFCWFVSKRPVENA